VQTYNAARGRTAYQSSTHYARLSDNSLRQFTAGYGNDGNHHTTWGTSPFCAVTQMETNPWWAVDLGQPTAVYGVKLTTSVFGSRKTNIIGL